jgi:hypothetical protein
LFDDLEIPDAETLISRLHSKNVNQIPSSLNEIENNLQIPTSESKPINLKNNNQQKIIHRNDLNFEQSEPCFKNLSKQSNTPTLILPSSQPTGKYFN